jgi:serine/threonine protein kinase
VKQDRFARLKELLLKAADLPESERKAYLDDACKDDPELRKEVEKILEHDADPSGILKTGAGIVNAGRASQQPTATAGDAPGMPERIACYRILQKLGEGGMGIVYLAEQEHPIRRRVALKIIKLGMDTKEVIGRFESERQALAIMDHPHVAKVFDAGTTSEGRPYFVMEHVSGVSITDYCNRYRLSTRERMELFVSVCQAIHHAHQKGIIHRDVKPNNILVGTKDGRPSPKIIDFGVAKAINQRLTEKTVYTEQGRLIGTPEYMSPEQAEMTGLDIDTTTDIYSLGVVLYELLVGALPFDVQVLREAGFEGIRHIIREVDPPKPSTRISTLGEAAAAIALYRKTEPATLVKQVRGEPDWIIMRAMEKDRTRRYQSASAFATDIERYLRNEPIIASPPSTVYRLRKLVKRHKGVFASLGAVFLALAIGVVISTTMYFRAETARRSAEGEARKAMAINEFVSKALVSSDPHQGGGAGFSGDGGDGAGYRASRRGRVG